MDKKPKLVNQVYNSEFQIARADAPDFPDGWLRVGGNEFTVWEWKGSPPGPRAIAIHHPSGPPAGIVQDPTVAVRAGEIQRWEVRTTLQVEPASTACYLLVHMSTASGYPIGHTKFTLSPTRVPETFKRVFSTLLGTRILQLEVGIIGPGELVIHSIEAYRLYPRTALSQDEKGRVLVRHVDTVGEILKPVRLAGPVNVSATVVADIRNLTPARDGVRIYGSGPSPLAITADGLARVQVAERSFRESVENVTAGVTPAATATQDISTIRLFSYAIFNSGTNPALVQIQISPDGNYWAADMPEQEVEPGSLLVLAPRFFLRYTRLAYRAAAPTALTVWFQAQS